MISTPPEVVRAFHEHRPHTPRPCLVCEIREAVEANEYKYVIELMNEIVLRSNT